MAQFPRFQRLGIQTPPFLPDQIQQDVDAEDPDWNTGYVDAPGVPPPPPPPMPSMKPGSMVGVPTPPIETGPPDIEAAPMKPPAQMDVPLPPPGMIAPKTPSMLQAELDALKAPERGPVSKWAKLGALGLGAAQGYYNAANPHARPIDNSEAQQALLLGPKYIAQRGEYDRKKKDISDRIKIAGDVEGVESLAANRKEMAQSRKDANEDRDTARRVQNFQVGVQLAQQGAKIVPVDSPVTPGAVRINANPLDPTGKTVVDIVPKNETRTIADPRIAAALGRKVGDTVSDAEHLQGAKEAWERDKSIELKKLELGAKKDTNRNETELRLAAAAGDPVAQKALKDMADEKVRVARESRPVADGGMSNPVANRVNSIAGNFDNEPAVKNYTTIREAREFVKSLGQGSAGNATDDQGLLYAFAKAMDPGSVVREGEYATVQKYAQSWAQNLGFKADRIFSNSPFLTDEARRQMKATVDKKYAAAEKNYRTIYDEYGRRIEKVGGVKNGREYITDYAKGADANADAGVETQQHNGVTYQRRKGSNDPWVAK